MKTPGARYDSGKLSILVKDSEPSYHSILVPLLQSFMRVSRIFEHESTGEVLSTPQKDTSSAFHIRTGVRTCVAQEGRRPICAGHYRRQ